MQSNVFVYVQPLYAELSEVENAATQQARGIAVAL